MCLGLQSSAITFDTGLIDSCYDLGINTEMKDRVQLRKIMTCLPPTIQGFFQDGTLIERGQNYSYDGLLYGPRNATSAPHTYILPDSIPLGNATFLMLYSDLALLPYIEEPSNPSTYTFE
jgi:hypothetical protein